MDGETFAEISKKFFFKNKERNLIDSIAVNISVKDGYVTVYPFAVAMDRYRAAVGGTQDLDMNFDYHISILKSPIPFKLGLNITGNLDDMKFRLGRAKYKNLVTPVEIHKVDSTVSGLGRQIVRDFKRRIGRIPEERRASCPGHHPFLRPESPPSFRPLRTSPHRNIRRQSRPGGRLSCRRIRYSACTTGCPSRVSPSMSIRKSAGASEVRNPKAARPVGHRCGCRDSSRASCGNRACGCRGSPAFRRPGSRTPQASGSPTARRFPRRYSRPYREPKSLRRISA